MHAREFLRALLLLLLLGAWALSGCAQHVVVRVPVLYPARVPVRAFPRLLVSGAALPEGDLVERLTQHLRGDGAREVEKIEVSELEPRRESGSISPLTLVLLIEPTLYSDVREDWETVPMQMCDFYWGCFTEFRAIHVTTPALVGEVTLTVYEGPTARPLQSERFEAVSFAEDTPAARARLLDELGRELEHAVDVLKSTRRVELLPVKDMDEVDSALAAIEAGDWHAGRRLLEQAARTLGGKSSSTQARVWYNLGVARWYGSQTGELTQEAYEAARRALALAASLEPRYRGAVQALERARERQAILEAQRRAAAHNFELAQQTAAPAAPAARSSERPASSSNASE